MRNVTFALVIATMATAGGTMIYFGRIGMNAREEAAEARLKAIEHRLDKLTSDFAMPDLWESPNGDRT